MFCCEKIKIQVVKFTYKSLDTEHSSLAAMIINPAFFTKKV